ncbi:hypothetical protein ATANTOWER_004931 [Ataeniobius toweri]|uniref:Uncharacterized protein n=1 Tax=Ataeniobius toweri TaxID=208326 RepID=A0ABU7CEM3_9TELE|nr:hypothetical protein [Ataeniobius toweri]
MIVFMSLPAETVLLLLLLLLLLTKSKLKSELMKTAHTSGVWLASFLDVSQNELIYDTASTCLVVGVPFLLDLLTPTRVCSEDGGSVTLFSEAPSWADHWQLAVPSAPAKQHGLGPPLFPTERPSLFWTHASAERQGVGG